MVTRIEIEIPDKVARFLEGVVEDVKEYCENAVLSQLSAELDSGRLGEEIISKKLEELGIDPKKIWA